jgi:hypothetical protein
LFSGSSRVWERDGGCRRRGGCFMLFRFLLDAPENVFFERLVLRYCARLVVGPLIRLQLRKLLSHSSLLIAASLCCFLGDRFGCLRLFDVCFCHLGLHLLALLTDRGVFGLSLALALLVRQFLGGGGARGRFGVGYGGWGRAGAGRRIRDVCSSRRRIFNCALDCFTFYEEAVESTAVDTFFADLAERALEKVSLTVPFHSRILASNIIRTSLPVPILCKLASNARIHHWSSVVCAAFFLPSPSWSVLCEMRSGFLMPRPVKSSE